MNPNHSTCKSLLVYLSDYVDGDLSKDLCQKIENHMAGCENCRVVVNTLRKTIEIYHDSAENVAELPDETRTQLYKILNLEDFLQR
jgi:predicted anti-sigma-YlaC factor YlaD